MTDQSPALYVSAGPVRRGWNSNIPESVRAAARARAAAEAPPSLAALFAAESASLTAAADLSHARAIVALARAKNLVADLAALN
jgi:hypothetical protein